jgi:glyoxylase-like metal-dependent hydrolase (beta-lactamase superfamily II)
MTFPERHTMAENAAQGAPAPDLHIPSASQTVDVYIIDTTSTVRNVPAHLLLSPSVEGYDWLGVPIFCFLVQHPGLGRSLLFDLGVRKDWENLSPPLLSRVDRLGWSLHAERDVHEILQAAGVNADKVEAIVWSHYHFDHTGNPDTFPRDTSLIVGPGFRSMLPGYPTDSESPILESDLASRQLTVLDFETGQAGNDTYKRLSIGGFRALDYFGDGSFYLLDTPGHAAGHISGLARVTADPPSFILLAGDAIHHPGELRPSKYLPLPESIIPDPFAPDPHPLESHYGCPRTVFDPLFAGRCRRATDPIFEPRRVESREESFHEDVDELLRTVGKLQAMDAHDNILVAAAHDAALLDHLEFFPDGKMNGFLEHGWVRRVRWRFLRDFAKAVGKEDHEVVKRTWGPEEREGN